MIVFSLFQFAVKKKITENAVKEGDKIIEQEVNNNPAL